MRSRVFCSGLIALTALATLPGAHPDAASASSILTQAVHDTNTVTTLVYGMGESQRYPNGNVISVTVQGQEDEVRNSEHDRETIVLRSKAKGGKLETRAYAVDVIFVGGKTYYEFPLRDKIWHEHAGMVYRDPLASFKRSRTKVSFKGATLKPAGSVLNGDLRFKGSFRGHGETAAMTVLVSTGKKPYIFSVALAGTLRGSKGQSLKFVQQTTYGPFDTPLSITAPVSSTLQPLAYSRRAGAG